MIEFSICFSPLSGCYGIDRFENFNISAFIAELQSLRDLCDGNFVIGKQKQRVSAFLFMNVFNQSLIYILFKLTADIALVVSGRLQDRLNVFRHEIFTL